MSSTFPFSTPTAQPSRILRYLLWLSLWGAGLWGSLKITLWEGTDTHSLCGIWGCGPPTNVLVGWHLFWCMVFIPMFLGGLRKLGGTCLLHLGQGLLATGLLTILGILGVDLVTWWPDANHLQRSYVVRRMLFSMVTTVEIPVLQVVLASHLYIVASRFKKSGDNCSNGSCSLVSGHSDDSHQLSSK